MYTYYSLKEVIFRGPEDQFDDSGETEYETKQRILSASMPFVHSQGWTQNAIAKGKF